MDDDRLDRIIERLDLLEQRLVALETTAPPPRTAPPTPPPVAWTAVGPANVIPPPLTRTSSPAPPAKDADYILGSQWLPRIGGAVMVLALVYFAHWAERQGLITPTMQFFGAMLLCVAFIAAGLMLVDSKEGFGKLLIGVGFGGAYATVAGGHFTWDLYQGEPMVGMFIAISLANLGTSLRLVSQPLHVLGFGGGLAGALMPLDSRAFALSAALILLVTFVSFTIAAVHRWSLNVAAIWLVSLIALFSTLMSAPIDPLASALLLMLHAVATIVAYGFAWGESGFEPLPALIPFVALAGAATAAIAYMERWPSNLTWQASVLMAVFGALLGLVSLARQWQEAVRGAILLGGLLVATLAAPWPLDPAVRIWVQWAVALALVLLARGPLNRGLVLMAALSLLFAGSSLVDQPPSSDSVRLLATLLIVATSFAAAYRWDPAQPEPLTGLFALAVLGSLWLTADASATFGRWIGQQPLASLTLLWVMLAAVLLPLGSVLRSVHLRMSGLAVIGAALGKVLLVDLSELELVLRIFLLFLLGAIMLALSYLLYLRPRAHP